MSEKMKEFRERIRQARKTDIEEIVDRADRKGNIAIKNGNNFDSYKKNVLSRIDAVTKEQKRKHEYMRVVYEKIQEQDIE